MAQPLTGQWAYIGTIGTVTQTDRTTNLVRVILPGTYAGTVVFHDAPSATGTTATSAVGTIGLPGLNTPSSVEFGVTLKKGLVTQATGTPNMTVIWE